MDRLSVAGPQQLTFYINGACDAACDFCKRESDEGVINAGTMTPALVDEIIDRFPSVSAVCIAGFGEPLLVKNLGEILSVLERRRIYVGLITNGNRLLERLDEIERWTVGYLSVSLNATDADEHRAVFKTSTWERVLAGIRGLASIRDLRYGASFVVTRRNIDRIPRMIDLARELDFNFVHLHNLLPHAGPRALSFLGGAIMEGSAEDRMIEELKLLPGADRITSWPAPVPTVSPLRCMSPFMSMGIDGRGHVSACRRIYEPSAEFGHFQDPDVWNNVHFTRYRQELSGALPASEMCKACFGSVRG